MTASTLAPPEQTSDSAQADSQDLVRQGRSIRALQRERFEEAGGSRGVFTLSSPADVSTISVELEAKGFGTLLLGRNDWGYDVDGRELFVDPGLLVKGTVIRVQYASS